MFEQVVGVLGGGQLGRMLIQAASPIGIPVVVLDPDVASPAKQVSQPNLIPSTSTLPPIRHLDGPFTSADKIREMAQQVDVLTIEIEHVDVDALEAVANEFTSTGGRSGKGIKVFPAPQVIRTIQDKYLQKVALRKKGIAVADFIAISSDAAVPQDPASPYASLVPSVLQAGDMFGYPLMLKSRRLAYDGRGNHVLKTGSQGDVLAALEALIPAASIGKEALGERLYAEKFAPFINEVAVMVVRDEQGTTRAYPAVETIHRDNICHIVYAPLRPPTSGEHGVGSEQKGKGVFDVSKLQTNAQEQAQQAIDALGAGAVGVFGVEMFQMGDGSLILNEIAPRPHNSGHYTIEACSPSQYTAHLYAILSLPLPPIRFIPAAAGMLNLLGATSSASDDFDPVVRRAIELGAAVHLYGKAGCRKGRKMGHITLVGESDAEVRGNIADLVSFLPEMYRDEPKEEKSALSSLIGRGPKLAAPEGPFSSACPLVSIIMGSDSDLPVMLPASAILKKFGVPFELSIVSAHRTPARMFEFARTAASRGVRVIIAGAGGAAHLPGMVASETALPVIGVPVKGSTLDGVDSLYSIVQMPRGIPVATVAINNSTNAALLAIRILGTRTSALQLATDQYATDLNAEVMAKNVKLEEVGWEAYVVKR